MSLPRQVLIVGGSLAGAKAAEGLRSGGFEGRIVLVGAEPSLPYARPELSKGYLLGTKTKSDLEVHPPAFYRDNDVEVLTSTKVTAIDPGASTVHLSPGGSLTFDMVLLATGASPRVLEVPGARLPGVMSLRTVEDADALRLQIPRSGRVVVVGSGWIGCEVAACARTLGAEVALVTPDRLPLVRVLGPEVAGIIRDLHRDRGVELQLGAGVDAVVGIERARGVRTSAGAIVEGDLVVVGVGVAPRDELAREAGLSVDNGILVDEYLATSNPMIFAAGDVANAWHPLLGARLRVEHWDNAVHQGLAAAGNMLGRSTAYTRLPFFYSDQFDLSLEYRGHATTWDQVVLRGDPESGSFLAFWLRAGRVLAAMNVNVWDQGEALDALLRSGARHDPERLADPGVGLTELVGGVE